MTEGLRAEGFAVDHAADGEAGYGLGISGNFDAVTLGFRLPGMQGMDISKHW
jgi:two-component system, OmpR family, response regulator